MGPTNLCVTNILCWTKRFKVLLFLPNSLEICSRLGGVDFNFYQASLYGKCFINNLFMSTILLYILGILEYI
jgi:hypothetical protein